MIQPQFIINLKGRSYPTWAGVLDAATKAGLRSLTTRVVQIPSAENGGMAIVMARAEFEDGRVFEDVGDASPANCSAQIATAAVRMASTRAKGRCLRDAINVGQTMFEELPDQQPAEPETNGHAARSEPATGEIRGACAECGLKMTAAQSTYSVKKFERELCTGCQRALFR
jgi:hypothetical protein